MAASIAPDVASDPKPPPGVTYHHNIVTLQGAFIQDVKWLPGVLRVSPGQESGVAPEITRDGDTWSIDIYCGRHKTPEVAAEFIRLNLSEDHIWNPRSLGDRQPRELNFYVGVEMELLINSNREFVTLYFAQGSNSTGNNWWIASPVFIANPSYPRIIPIQSPLGQALQVVEIMQNGDNGFAASLWFDRSAKPAFRPPWIAQILDDDLSIGDINLPGTHDSAAITRFGPVGPWACHKTSLTEQMDAGVRLFDIRLKVMQGPDGDFYFMTCHGKVRVFGLNEFQTFESAMEEFKAYLERCNREFLVVMLDIDDWNGFGDELKPLIYAALRSALDPYRSVFNTNPSLPKLGQIRGQFYLLNRINQDPELGLPFEVPKNTRGIKIEASPRDFSYWVQDWFKDYPDNFQEVKFEAWLDALEQVATVDLVFNFATGQLAIGLVKIDIMGDILAHFGASLATDRPSRLGWSLFDFENLQFPTIPYGPTDIVDVWIASNFGWKNYEGTFFVDTGPGRLL